MIHQDGTHGYICGRVTVTVQVFLLDVEVPTIPWSFPVFLCIQPDIPQFLGFSSHVNQPTPKGTPPGSQLRVHAEFVT
jgi:hypothetical protein